MENVKSEITKISPCKTKAKFIIEKPLLEKFSNDVLTEIQKKAHIPGFRKGFAPIEVIKTRYKDTAKTEIINKTFNEAILPTLKENNYKYILDSIKFNNINLDEEKCLYEIEFELEPDFKLKSYKGLKLKKEIKKVTEKDIEDALNALKEDNATLVISKKEKIETADIEENSSIFIVVNYKIFLEGKEIKELSGQNSLIPLSTKNLPDGLKEGVVGMTRNETRKIKAVLPANFKNTELASKEVEFNLTLIEIKEKQYPVLDNEFAKNIGFENFDSLKSYLNQKIKENYEIEADNKLRQQIFDILVKEHNFPIPEYELKLKENELLEIIKKDFIQRGGKEQDFNLTEQLQNELKQKAERQVKLYFILRKIIETEKINITNEELQKEKGKILALYPQRQKEVENYFSQNIDEIASKLLEDKVISLIVNNAKIKEVVV